MKNILFYFCVIFLIIYILSPWDAHPHFIDDLIAAGLLFRLWYQFIKRRSQRGQYDYQGRSQQNKQSNAESNLCLEDAYNELGVKPDASWEEIQKAYKDKVAKSHPDKVAHLSEGLQMKAKELTLTLNMAFDIIKNNK